MSYPQYKTQMRFPCALNFLNFMKYQEEICYSFQGIQSMAKSVWFESSNYMSDWSSLPNGLIDPKTSFGDKYVKFIIFVCIEGKLIHYVQSKYRSFNKHSKINWIETRIGWIRFHKLWFIIKKILRVWTNFSSCFLRQKLSI